MKAILEFDLYGEKEEFYDALNGHKWKYIVTELDDMLRDVIKYGDDEEKIKHYKDIRDALTNKTLSMDLSRD